MEPGHLDPLQGLSMVHLLCLQVANIPGPFRAEAATAGCCGGFCEGGVLIINWKLSSVAGSLGM